MESAFRSCGLFRNNLLLFPVQLLPSGFSEVRIRIRYPSLIETVWLIHYNIQWNLSRYDTHCLIQNCTNIYMLHILSGIGQYAELTFSWFTVMSNVPAQTGAAYSSMDFTILAINSW